MTLKAIVTAQLAVHGILGLSQLPVHLFLSRGKACANVSSLAPQVLSHAQRLLCDV